MHCLVVQQCAQHIRLADERVDGEVAGDSDPRNALGITDRDGIDRIDCIAGCIGEHGRMGTLQARERGGGDGMRGEVDRLGHA